MRDLLISLQINLHAISRERRAVPRDGTRAEISLVTVANRACSAVSNFTAFRVLHLF